MSFIFVALFVALFAVWFYKRTRKPDNFPPGPPRWPIVGSLPHISNKQNNLLLGLREPFKKYGPLVGYYVGSTPIVLVADYDVLKVAQLLDFLLNVCLIPNLCVQFNFKYSSREDGRIRTQIIGKQAFHSNH